jgi:hypothetical protein
MRHLLLLTVLLLGSSWAVAQNEQSPTPPNRTTNGEQPATPTNAGGDMTVQGCLSGSAGNYMLTDQNGTMYQLAGDTAKLSEHVGHEIKVTGSTSSTATGGGNTSGTMESSKQTLQVSSFQHISKTCKNSGMSH